MDLESRIKEMPFFTKWFIGACLATSTCASFKIISPYKLILSWESLMQFELWRLISNFLFFGTFSFNLVITLIMIYFGVGNCEKIYLDLQKKYYSDFFYLILFSMSISIIIGLLFNFPILGPCFVMSLLYVWCKKRPLEKVSFFFGIIVNSGWLPWVLVGWNTLTGQSTIQDLLGIGIGHLYILLKDILPNSKSRLNILETPKFFSRFINQQFLIDIPREQQQQQGAFGGYRAFQGQGQRIN